MSGFLAPDRAAHAERLEWHSVDSAMPDADITVLVWLESGEWFSAWWDDGESEWHDAATGGVLEAVTHWAEPEGPLPKDDGGRVDCGECPSITFGCAAGQCLKAGG